MAHLPVHGVILFIAKHWQTNTIRNIHSQVFQRSKGIRQLSKNYYRSPFLMNKTWNYPIRRLQLVVKTFGQST